MTAAAPEVAGVLAGDWVHVCSVDDLVVERGAAAIVAGVQVALFRLRDGVVAAVSQRDPYSGANVISRGIVGSRRDVPTVAGPMYKQVFSLLTGECLERAGYEPVDGGSGDLQVWDVRVVDREVHVAAGPRS